MQRQGRAEVRTGQKQGSSRVVVSAELEQYMSRGRSRAGRQEQGRSWAGAEQEQGKSRAEVGQEQREGCS